ncbi:helix-turn-helix transcriptional regulator [Streptococcus hyovaginalis]|uniref:helix-turn-helix transcriptional regulator n=2 Tax=Streptococcus hyovaginalis TaxID=149015 RepID=UPI00041D843C|nr:WYL domain-containing protein [Streptococcus hyovaginalis]
MNSQERVLSIFINLLHGQKLKKKELEEEFGVSGKSIQRDMEIIDKVIDKKLTENLGNMNYYSQKYDDTVAKSLINRDVRGTYFIESAIERKEHSHFSKTEALVLLDMIMSTRGLSNVEVNQLSQKILSLSTDSNSVKKFIQNELYHYKGVPSNSIVDKISTLMTAIENGLIISFDYKKLFQKKHFEFTPDMLFYSDMYFYISSSNHLYSQTRDDMENLTKFRVNNMDNLTVLGQGKKRDYNDRFQVGVMRNQTGAFAYFGKEIKVVIDFYHEPAYVLDRFPNSRLLWTKNGVSRIEIISNDGEGIKLWLSMQGDMLKIISPVYLKNWLVENLQKTLSYYQNSLPLEEKRREEKRREEKRREEKRREEKRRELL